MQERRGVELSEPAPVGGGLLGGRECHGGEGRASKRGNRSGARESSHVRGLANLAEMIYGGKMLHRWFLALLASLTLLVLPRMGWAHGDQSALSPPQVLEVKGHASSYFVPPRSTRRRNQPLFVWLHGRGGDPEADCRKWAKVTRGLGWLLCVSGQEDRGAGARGWGNSWPASQLTVDAAVDALLRKYPRRIRSHDDVIIGFSEGSLVAMNVGVREPKRFNRWLILAANDSYWGGEGLQVLHQNAGSIRRVYLLTGAKDMIVDSTRRVFQSIEDAHVHVRMWIPEDIGHEVPPDRMRLFYHKPLLWLLTKSKH